jgi:hypothetical protein
VASSTSSRVEKNMGPSDNRTGMLLCLKLRTSGSCTVFANWRWHLRLMIILGYSNIPVVPLSILPTKQGTRRNFLSRLIWFRRTRNLKRYHFLNIVHRTQDTNFLWQVQEIRPQLRSAMTGTCPTVANEGKDFNMKNVDP